MNLDELFQQQIDAGDTVVWYMLQQPGASDQITITVRKHQLTEGPVALIEPDLAGYVYKESNGQGWPLFVKETP
jgi:hypothetical protein